MPRLLPAAVVVFAIAVGCQHQPPVITHVRVLDPDFNTIGVVTNKAVLDELNQIWTERITVEPSSVHEFTHKIDVTTGETGTRWIYDPSGYATVLSKARMPIFKFKNPEKLKGILISQQGAEGTAENGAP